MDSVAERPRKSGDKAAETSRGFSVRGSFLGGIWAAGWYRALGLGGIHSLFRLALSFITIKVTAVYLGPSGIALVAQLVNFIALASGFFGGGITTATSRLYPEFRHDPVSRKRFLATAWYLACGLGVVSIVVIALGAAPLARWLLTSDEHVDTMMLAGIAVACMVLNGAIVSAINGAGEMGRVVVSGLIGSVVAFAVYVPASMLWGVTGGLIGFAVSQMAFLPVTLWLLRGSPGVARGDFHGPFDPVQARRILSFMPMLLAHSVMSPLGLILIRDLVASHLGLATAGIWQAAWRLSEVYTGVVMASVSMYFLPRLGEVAGTPALRGEIIRTFWRAVGITAAFAVMIFLLRDWVVWIVFTDEFLPVRDLMPYQLLGDVVKMAAWTLGFVLVALVRSRWYIALEIAVPAIYFGGALWLVPQYGAQGVTWAYCLSAAVHLVVSVLALRDILLSGPRRLNA